MKALAPLLTVLFVLSAAPALAGGHGGGQGGGCCGGRPGGNVNVNVNAHAGAEARAYAGARTYVNARAYEVASVGRRGPGYGGVIHTNGGGPVNYGYGSGVVGYGPVEVRGPGYGPSRPFGYVVGGFGRYYGAAAPWNSRYAAPPLPCDCHGDAYSRHGGEYGTRGEADYRSYESYSETSAYASGYAEDGRRDYRHEDRYADRRDAGPRYAPIPYYASPLEPVPYEPEYVPPPVVHDAPAYAPRAYEPSPYAPPPGYYGDLPPGDTGEGLPYRQEPGERG